jgi:hypothetical protein
MVIISIDFNLSKKKASLRQHPITCINKNQGVTKRCRLSWLANSALVYEPKYSGRG